MRDEMAGNGTLQPAGGATAGGGSALHWTSGSQRICACGASSAQGGISSPLYRTCTAWW